MFPANKGFVELVTEIIEVEAPKSNGRGAVVGLGEFPDKNASKGLEPSI